MDKIDKNGRTIFIFIVILLAIVIGGYFLIKNNKSEDTTNDNDNNKVEKISKYDKRSDYIYLTSEEVVSEELGIINKQIIFNFESNDAKELQSKLNDNMKNASSSLKKISETDTGDEEIEDIDDIYSVDIIDYDIIESNKYISLIVSNYSYSAVDGLSDKDYTYYVFDIYTGNLIGNKEIMKNENITDQVVRSKIREYVNNDEAVDIDVTLNNPYYLTVAKNGTVMLNFVVNRDNLNYNVSIEMDWFYGIIRNWNAYARSIRNTRK